ncbi:hypothetical protein GALLR39Z86_29500 [Glycomyces algeriensis]|uniref:Uncharacterized protein n=1 Tax=Glycomyces algeriensis TaxID=256037 RepID=A0A9W6G8B4_9ACTN|nr:hypothetical protein GALLR39Z86_29500 [Glycomyces algeriensis]
MKRSSANATPPCWHRLSDGKASLRSSPSCVTAPSVSDKFVPVPPRVRGPAACRLSRNRDFLAGEA